MTYSHRMTYSRDSTPEDLGLLLNMLQAWLWSQRSFTSTKEKKKQTTRLAGENQRNIDFGKIHTMSKDQAYIPLRNRIKAANKVSGFIYNL